MRIARHVVTRKTQWLVALPSEVRHRLGLTPGVMVWWHVGKKRQATLTVSGRVRAGRPAIDEDCPTCAKLRAELDRLRSDQRESVAGTAGGFFKAGYMRALGDVGSFKADLQVALVMLKQLLARERRASSSRSGGGGRSRALVPPRPVEVVEAPVLVGSDGEPIPTEARDPLSGAVVRAVLSEGHHSP